MKKENENSDRMNEDRSNSSTSTSLIIRPNDRLSRVKPDIERSLVDRRSFLVAASAAAVGSFWIKPLHVEARAGFWTKLVDFFKSFAQGILFGFLNQIMPPSLAGQMGQLGSGVKMFDDGAGTYTLEQIISQGTNVKNILQRIMSHVGSRQWGSVFAHVSQLIDALRKPLGEKGPVLFSNAPAITVLGEVASGFVGKYALPAAGAVDTRPGLLSPKLEGGLIGSAVSAQHLKLDVPFLDRPKFNQIYEDEKGNKIVVDYASQSVKNSGGVIQRGQGQATVSVISKTSPKKEDKEAYVRFRDVIRKNLAQNAFWTNEANRAALVRAAPSYSSVPTQPFGFDFENDR
jgi:hypothetical protein